MAKHNVEISAGAPRMRGSRSAKTGGGAERDLTPRQRAVEAIDEDGIEGVFGIEHKPHLSLAVMRAVGLYKGDVPATDTAGADKETAAAHERARKLHAAYQKARGVDTSKKGAKKAPVVRDGRDTEGAIFLPPPESNEDCMSAADAVLLMSHRYGGYLERTPIVDEDGREFATVRFTYGPTADVVTASAEKTKDAVRALFAKLGETFPCLEPVAVTEGSDDE